MHLPSFWGLMPRSDSWMAFSIPLRILASHGVMTSVRGSGEPIDAICWMGVGVP